MTATSTPILVGTVNLTEDSFSDGGRYLDPDRAIAQALRLQREGAGVIELGPASSHPDSRQVSPDEEIRRLRPVLRQLAQLDLTLSIDSFQPTTQALGLQAGVAYLNDTHGFATSPITADLAAARCRLVVVHSVQQTGRATRVHTRPETVWDSIDRFFDDRIRRLEAAGITRDRLILDPGMGFFLGSNAEPSLLVLGDLRRLRERFGLPLLISVSRKSFLRAVTGRSVEEVGPETLAAELIAARQGVEYIRTHDVGALRAALQVVEAVGRHRD